MSKAWLWVYCLWLCKWVGTISIGCSLPSRFTHFSWSFLYFSCAKFLCQCRRDISMSLTCETCFELCIKALFLTWKRCLWLYSLSHISFTLWGSASHHPYPWNWSLSSLSGGLDWCWRHFQWHSGHCYLSLVVPVVRFYFINFRKS